MRQKLLAHPSSVQCSPADFLVAWRDLTGPHSPIALSFHGSARWVLRAEPAPGAPAPRAEWLCGDDPLTIAERIALEWLAAGRVARPAWRVPLHPVERLAELVALDASDLLAVLRGEIELDALDPADALPLASGACLGRELLAVAAVARGVELAP